MRRNRETTSVLYEVVVASRERKGREVKVKMIGYEGRLRGGGEDVGVKVIAADEVTGRD